jgi:O-antigen ligase
VNLRATSLHAFDRASSGRLDLLRGGLAMFGDRPLQGYGSGAFAKQFRKRENVGSRTAATASHTIPVTVAAEQGIVGLAAYVFLLVAAFALVFRGLGELRQRVPPLRLVSRAYVAAAFTGLVLHTLLYAAFLEDPITWALLAAGVVFSRPEPSALRPSSASARAQSPSSA